MRTSKMRPCGQRTGVPVPGPLGGTGMGEGKDEGTGAAGVEGPASPPPRWASPSAQHLGTWCFHGPTCTKRQLQCPHQGQCSVTTEEQ